MGLFIYRGHPEGIEIHEHRLNVRGNCWSAGITKAETYIWNISSPPGPMLLFGIIFSAKTAGRLMQIHNLQSTITQILIRPRRSPREIAHEHMIHHKGNAAYEEISPMGHPLCCLKTVANQHSTANNEACADFLADNETISQIGCQSLEVSFA